MNILKFLTNCSFVRVSQHWTKTGNFNLLLFNAWGHAVVPSLRHYATSWKVTGSISDEVNEFFSIYLIIPAALGSGVDSASNRNEYQKQKNNVSGE
jgi:hypothetical protein